MMAMKPCLPLENGLDLREVVTKGSLLQINADCVEEDDNVEFEKPSKIFDFIGKPVMSFSDLKKTMFSLDNDGFVKKEIIIEGGGLPLDKKNNTVSVAFSGYWEKELEPFDKREPDKPLVVDLNDSGLLPGLHMAIESMLVGETSVFLLSYNVMYGELGNPPRIRPKADCVFYVKLIKSIITPKERLDFKEPNIFNRVLHEVKLLYGSGLTLHKCRQYPAAIQVFRKAVYMLHRCRLADENEEIKQEKMLKKLYINLAVCYNLTKTPLKACIACNELNRLNNLWNNAKALLQNAKALRMIGQYDAALKKLKRAKHLCPDKQEIDAEMKLLLQTKAACNQSKLIVEKVAGPSLEVISKDFKRELDQLIKNFKENDALCKLVLPGELNKAETDYIKEVCVRENVFFNRIHKDFALDKDGTQLNATNDQSPECNYYGDDLYE